MSVRIHALTSAFLLCFAPAVAAQQLLPGWNVVAWSQDRISEHHGFLIGAVEIEQGNTKLYADHVEIVDEEHIVATGNVVLTQANNRISAERGEFNPKTKLGTFYSASGIANVKPPQMAPQPGLAVPQMAGAQDTDVYFFGEKVEKIGYKKYKISNGGFSTCVQPTPRWDLSADTIVLNVDHYTTLTQAILKVKGVPLFYLPFMYYPTNDEDRATGFILPTYGMTQLRGQTIKNAFFWAINRSHDATLMHDWYSKTGQAYAGEYRFNVGGGSDGGITARMIDEHAAAYVQPDGSVLSSDAKRSYDIDGGANYILPGNMRARARVDYFSSVITNQTFHTDIYNAATNNRSYGANVVGAWRTWSLNGTFDRSEWFTSYTSSGIRGNSPRIMFNRNERPLFSGSPVYFSFGSDIGHLDNQTRSGPIVNDRSLGRVDITPTIRYPFKRWQFFTVNSSVSWRDTYYTRSLDESGVVVDEAINRRFFTLAAQATGPVFNRIWDTPDNGYASRFKHTVEPFVSIQRTSGIDQYSQIVVTDSSDNIVGNTTTYSYGLNNRFYAKRRVGQGGQAQEFASVTLQQSYYTDARAGQCDPRYNSSCNNSVPTKFSPILLSARTTPTVNLDTTVSAEIDSKYLELRTLSVNGRYNWSNRISTQAGWTHKFFIEELPGFNTRSALDHYLNVMSNVHTVDNRVGGIYSLNYDVLRGTMLAHSYTGFYNTQCCGIAMQYAKRNFPTGPNGGFFLTQSDRQFYLSFTLAGLGSFSPFNGALGGVPR